MLKTGFRGERKGILTPSLSQGEGECSDSKEECSDRKGGMWRRKGNPHLVHILSYSETSPKERGNVAIVKRNVVTEKGECCDGKGK